MINDVLKEREKTHGSFFHHAQATQQLKAVMRTTYNWSNLNNADREALEMIAHKIARILSGDPDHADHWVDIAGYATLRIER
jgi:hypothetical protein